MSTARTAIHPPSGLRPALAVLGALVLSAIVITLIVDRIFVPDSSSTAGTGSGVASTQTRSVPPFTGIALSGANNVIVTVGAKRSVVVHADSNLLGRVTTRVRAGRLVIGTTSGSLRTRSPMYVSVSVPSLDRVSLPGEGNISVSGIDTRHLTVALPGSGNIEVGGAATKVDVRLSGEGTASLRGLTARDATATLGGDGTIMLTATNRLVARLSGTGTILYGGNPTHLTQRLTGTGTITPG
jgi:hypothetical protein